MIIFSSLPKVSKQILLAGLRTWKEYIRGGKLLERGTRKMITIMKATSKDGGPWWQILYWHFISGSNISSRFSSNSETDVSELLENLEEMLRQYYMDGVDIINKFKSSTRHWCVTGRDKRRETQNCEFIDIIIYVYIINILCILWRINYWIQLHSFWRRHHSACITKETLILDSEFLENRE